MIYVNTFSYAIFFILIHGAKVRIIFETAKIILQMQCFSALAHGNGADEYGRRDTAVDVAMALVGTFLVG